MNKLCASIKEIGDAKCLHDISLNAVLQNSAVCATEIRKKIKLLLKILFLKDILDTRGVTQEKLELIISISNFCFRYYKALSVKVGVTKSDFSSTAVTPPKA